MKRKSWVKKIYYLICDKTEKTDASIAKKLEKKILD